LRFPPKDGREPLKPPREPPNDGRELLKREPLRDGAWLPKVLVLPLPEPPKREALLRKAGRLPLGREPLFEYELEPADELRVIGAPERENFRGPRSPFERELFELLEYIQTNIDRRKRLCADCQPTK